MTDIYRSLLWITILIIFLNYGVSGECTANNFEYYDSQWHNCLPCDKCKSGKGRDPNEVNILKNDKDSRVYSAASLNKQVADHIAEIRLQPLLVITILSILCCIVFLT